MAILLKDGDRPRIDDQSPLDIDNILSKDLLQLTLRDRNAIDEEIHGVLTLCPEESPQLLEASLRQLSLELEAIPDDCPSKSEYMESQRFPETYVNSNDFRLRFLRCELFDAKKAAIRITSFLSIASDLFGPEVLQRPIRFADFTKEEEKILRMGFVQKLPYRDRAGRSMIIWVGDFEFRYGDFSTRARITLYYLYSASHDLEDQRKGIVTLTWVGSDSKAHVPSWKDVRFFSRVYEGSPIRECSNHFCLPDRPAFHVIRAMYAMTLLDNDRVRLKFHVGEGVELRYTLQSYGIPVELIPVTGTGNIKTVYHKQWIRLRKNLDDTRAKGTDNPSIIECPRSTDVVFRTGLSLTCHPGNSMFQSIIESKIIEHTAASQARKFAITKEIIDRVKKKEGRFLQWDTRGWWTELKGGSQIHTKVAVSVRDFKSKVAVQNNRQSSQSSTSVFQNQDGKRRKISRYFDGDSDRSANNDTCWFGCTSSK